MTGMSLSDKVSALSNLIVEHLATGAYTREGDNALARVISLILDDLEPHARTLVLRDPANNRVQIENRVFRRSSSTAFRREMNRLLNLPDPGSSVDRTRIFISYRRGASRNFVQRLADGLRSQPGFGVFLDETSMPAGRFTENLGAAIRNCDLFLLVLGPGTFDRTQEPEDILRREIETAFATDKLMLGIAVDDVPTPAPSDLPNTLQDLLGIHFSPFVTRIYETDLQKLTATIRRSVRLASRR